MARIELDKVSLTFRVRPNGRLTLKDFLVRQMFRRAVNPQIKVRALRDVTLRINEGDRVGIIGHNGAGKSTLLKLLAGIYPPTRGKRIVEGHISSLFDISLGFEPDASGWENIANRGYLQGETPRSIKAKMQPIAEFSELGRFLDLPVRYYSAGMLVRLAFAIATAIDPEILLVDEVLAVGDMAFQTKARQRMREMMAKARLLVMISHDLDYLGKVCDRGIWMDHGEVRQVGLIGEVMAAYTAHVQGQPSPTVSAYPEARSTARRIAAGDGSHTAAWRFNTPTPGLYEVQATWGPFPGAAISAPYRIYDGDQLLATVRVNQHLSPFGTTVDGVVFQGLGTYRVKDGPLRVVLSNDTETGEVLAEAVRVAQAPPEKPLIVDNSYPAYQETGTGWTNHSGLGGYGNRYSYTRPGNGSETATWQVDGLAPEEYEVQATWTPYPNRATNAPYRIYDGSRLLATVRVNQQPVPTGTAIHGVIFHSLGTFAIRDGTLRVVLSNDADGYVIANAIHVARKPSWGPVVIHVGQAGYEERGARWAA